MIDSGTNLFNKFYVTNPHQSWSVFAASLATTISQGTMSGRSE
jgi:hypothetical protein